MRESRDETLIEREDILLLPASQLKIPGLHMMGHAKFHRAGDGLDQHYHPNCVEFVAVLEGHQVYQVGSDIFHLYGGDLFTAFTGEAHSTGREPQMVSEILWFQLNLTERDGFWGLAAPWDSLLLEQARRWSARIIKLKPEQIELLKQVFQCFAESRGTMPTACIRGMGLLLAFLTDLFSCDHSVPSIDQDIETVLRMIETRLCEPLQLEDLARAARLSTSWLKAKFREQIGISPRAYMNWRKIERAKELLLQEELSVTQVAYALGFSSSSYFAQVFRKFTGVSPSAYGSYQASNAHRES